MPPTSTTPTLIVIGGFAGTGKTTIARRLSRDFAIPRLSSDAIGQTIRASKGASQSNIDAFWIAYDVVFWLCEDFLADGVSVVPDINMGWSFQWERVDAIIARQGAITCIPIILRCPLDVCLDRIRLRYTNDPTSSNPPETYTTTLHILDVWQFLDHLGRHDVTVIDAARWENEVYDAVKQRIARPPALRLPRPLSSFHHHRHPIARAQRDQWLRYGTVAGSQPHLPALRDRRQQQHAFHPRK